ncbi:hypothetical protein NM208_g1059 [Fusarium decemcellulare]|uniref:Uncharacterized protein n=1 Tax=Fusarium decemcellulare TaxID=57161 RepID=A0ACC1SX58_9HYPO|nr:hypothetical protein NM208_g1059 [Fusarium decemcellulare]
MSWSYWSAAPMSADETPMPRVDDINSYLGECDVLFKEFEGLCLEVRAISVKPGQKETIAPGAEHLWAEREDLWPAGREISVAFLGKLPEHITSEVLNIIKESAKSWTEGANISFKFLDSSTDDEVLDIADVRITFQQPSSWSLVGNKVTRKGRPTMSLLITPWTPKDAIRRTTLHEFGHALGFRHEHTSPNSPLVFNETTLAKYKKDTGVDEGFVARNLLVKGKPCSPLASPFDKLSIMIYRFRPSWTLGKEDIPRTIQLSEKDKEMVKEAYPFESNNKRKASHGDLPFGEVVAGTKRRSESFTGASQSFFNLPHFRKDRRVENGKWCCDKESCKPAGRQCDECFQYGKRVTLAK